ncbi:type I methionyl aminopeptidase [Fusibacter ferrireducens]|uniref:Methionine aminopeptidase n=1 Tax=Fusibacter ferrireducens TaxID=2785058 RepID=A0ABR9ZWE6_9FIRM|nr:type I methionyl aminopeptidase [Fusibacter ferrireducens]MBF4694797.1 type I methionyl aminopeptidase [Fusibacter ferrireducens]
MIVKTQAERDALECIGRIVSKTRDAMVSSVRVGMTTRELDEIGGRILEKYGAKSAPMIDYHFPGYTCISVNQTVAHGIPDDYKIKSGDLINVDVSAVLDGFYADTGKSIVVGDPIASHTVKQNLCRVAYEAMIAGISAAKLGNQINDIGISIFETAKKNGYTVIMNLTGHGIGRALHETPQAISNYYCRSENDKIELGQVLAIETFISNGSNMVRDSSNGWALKTIDGGFVAQFEHTIIVQEDGPAIITL